VLIGCSATPDPSQSVAAIEHITIFAALSRRQSEQDDSGALGSVRGAAERTREMQTIIDTIDNAIAAYLAVWEASRTE
jgi:hypothetical protein